MNKKTKSIWILIFFFVFSMIIAHVTLKFIKSEKSQKDYHTQIDHRDNYQGEVSNHVKAR